MKKIEILLKKGVKILHPQSVEIAEDVDLNKISKTVTIHPGCRLRGSSLFLDQGVKIGEEAPVTLDDCQLGKDVALKGGFFKNSVFLEKASMGSGAHIREGCILEEQAGGAHTVGLKHTILFPFVTLGSLVNFCDCFMSGGTSRKDHSEVGSSYIHFNYTPNQDKATASLLGNVSKGVMLNQRPIFLGGQGGLVGPTILEFGTMSAAGTIIRKDEKRQGRMIFGGALKAGSVSFSSGSYGNLKRIITNNALYIGNLHAMFHWYKNIRKLFIGKKFPEPLYEGVLKNLRLAISERVKRLEFVSENMPASVLRLKKISGEKETSEMLRQKSFHHNFERLKEISLAVDTSGEETVDYMVFRQTIEKKIENLGPDYLSVVKHLSEQEALPGTLWLGSICDGIVQDIVKLSND